MSCAIVSVMTKHENIHQHTSRGASHSLEASAVRQTSARALQNLVIFDGSDFGRSRCGGGGDLMVLQKTTAETQRRVSGLGIFAKDVRKSEICVISRIS